MRIIKKAGLAGVPGVSLSERDFRLLALGRSPGLAGIDCTNCGNRGGTDADVAAKVAEYLGSPELSAAVRDPSRAPQLTDAALLASATREVMKFATDKFAVLAGITSPQFATAVRRSTARLKGKAGEDQALTGALVLVYMTGAVEASAGRNTQLARDFRRALRDLRAAMDQAGSRVRLAGLGYVDPTSASANWMPGRQEPTYGYSAKSERGYAPTAAWADPSRFWPPARKVNEKDAGALDRLPDALSFVPFDRIVKRLWAVSGKAAASSARGWAAGATFAGSAVDLDGAADRTASWIIRFADDRTLASIRSANHDENRFRGNIAWLALAYRYGVTILSREKDASLFEKHAARMMAMGAKQAVERTAQTGGYGADGIWEPAPGGSEQVPLGPEADKYAGVWDKLTIDPKPRPEAIFLAQEAYQRTYRKEPTLHALNWHGSFGYGIDKFGDYFGLRASAQSQNDLYSSRVGKTEGVRMAGGAVPPQDAQNNTNVFMSVFNAIGPGLSVVLDGINTGIQFAIDSLCATFRVIFGPDIGGVLCSIFTALLKYMGGSIKASVAILATIAKALIGLIGALASGDWKGALFAFFGNVNIAVFFFIGGPFADMLGVPFLKSDEKRPNTVGYMPSLERMGEDMAKKNPLFLVMLTINVLSVIFTPSPVTIGALLFTLSPIVGALLTSPVAMGLSLSKEEWLKPYRSLPTAEIQKAVESLYKMVCGIIIGAMNLDAAMKTVGDRMAKFAAREGGAGPATVKTLQFFVTNLYSRLGSVTVQITQLVSNPNGFDLKTLLDDLRLLLMEFLALIPAFAIDIGFDKEGQAAATMISTVGASTAQEAYAAFDAVARNLDATARIELVREIVAQEQSRPAGTGTSKYGAPASVVGKDLKPRASFPLLAVAAAAGFTVAFMFSGKGRA